MNRSWASASGIVFAVLVVAGIYMLIIGEIDTKTDEEILSHYADSANRAQEIVGFFLVTVGVLFFLWFVSTLRSRLQFGEPEPRTLSPLAFGAGVAAAVLLIGAAAAFAGTSFAVDIASEFGVDPNLARLSASTGYLLLMASVFVNCVLVIATSLLALRTAVLPKWLGWVGFAAVVLAVLEAALAPVFVIPVWVLVVSIVLMMPFSTSDTQAAEPETT